MERVQGKIEGPFFVDRDLAVHGMITEHATVRAGFALALHGMVTGDLVVEAGARATIHGMVNGAVINNGGHVEIFGMVDSVRDRSPLAVTVIAPNARVRDQQSGNATTIEM